MSKASKHPAIAMPTAAEDQAITSAAQADPDAVSVRYSHEVLTDFEATGEGWQSGTVRHVEKA